jgi:hypothetical protein|tara:strand:+ start:149 stop:346 length:198 start_codon:yes stop_codon:yes gene_type:complete
MGSSKIEFFDLRTDEPITTGDYFVMRDGSVWRDNYAEFESQEKQVTICDFIEECLNVGWKIKGKI